MSLASSPAQRPSSVNHGFGRRPPTKFGGSAAPVILANASKIILVHNRPSGEPEPSSADPAVTRKVVEAAKLMDILVQEPRDRGP